MISQKFLEPDIATKYFWGPNKFHKIPTKKFLEPEIPGSRNSHKKIPGAKNSQKIFLNRKFAQEKFHEPKIPLKIIPGAENSFTKNPGAKNRHKKIPESKKFYKQKSCFITSNFKSTILVIDVTE